jgi:hypothetical protein
MEESSLRLRNPSVLSEISGTSEFSKQTVNEYIQAGREYFALNLMIQMEYCTDQTLQEYLEARNASSAVGLIGKKKGSGLVDR